MSLNKDQLKDLMLTVVQADRKNPVAFSYGDKKFSYDQLNDALRSELKELAGDYANYRKNKNILFELIEEVVELNLPKVVFENMKEFAEIKTFAHGDKPYFKRKQSALRGKTFVTRAAVGGVYEAFKLSSEVIHVNTQSYGGAAQIGLEEFLEGSVDFAELIDIIMVGFEQAVYKEVINTMIALSTNGIANYQGGITNALPANNIVTAAGWAPVQFNNLISIARAYGEPVIFMSQQFAYNVKPDSGWFVSDIDREEIRNNGYVGRYNGARIVVLPQSFYDVSNTATQAVVPAGYAWIIPAGDDKPVKVAFEGETVVEEFANRDWSKEIQVFKKFGVTMIAQPGIGVYVDTALSSYPANVGPIFVYGSGSQTPTWTRNVTM
jgi:hypothetical protein